MRWGFVVAWVACGAVGVGSVVGAGCSSFTTADDEPTGGGNEASVATDAGADFNFDAGAALFADDFERSGLQGPWSRVPQASGGNAIAIDSMQQAHGTNSLHATVSGKGGIAFLERTGSYPPLTRIELSLRADKSSNPGVVLARVQFESGTILNLAFSEAGLKLSEEKAGDGSSGSFASSQGTGMPMNQWVSLVWTIDYGAKSVRLTSPDHPLVGLDYTLQKNLLGSQVVAIQAGVVYDTDQNVGANVWIDDFAIY